MNQDPLQRTDTPPLSHRVDEVLPDFALHGDVRARHGQLQELPLGLRLQHLPGELGGPRRVGEGDEPQLFVCGGEQERERVKEARACGGQEAPGRSQQKTAEPMVTLQLWVSKGNLWMSILQVATSLTAWSDTTMPS